VPKGYSVEGRGKKDENSPSMYSSTKQAKKQVAALK
jgi:hypothetical protein